PDISPLSLHDALPIYRPTVDVLLAAKANVNAKNRFGDTPLMAAALNGHLEIVRRLRTQGADLEPRGWTPLIYAATGGHDDVVVRSEEHTSELQSRSDL